jgi:hypothetical protein
MRPARAAERPGDGAGIARRITQGRDIGVGAHTDHKRYAAAGRCRTGNGVGWRGGLRAGIGPPCQQHLHSLAASARVDKRRIEVQRSVEVSDRTVSIVLGFVGFAAGLVAERMFRIEPNCFGGVGDRVVVIVLSDVGEAGATVGDSILRVEPERMVQVSDRRVIVALVVVGVAAVDVGVSKFWICLVRLNDRPVVIALAVVNSAAAGVGLIEVRVEPDCLIVVRDRAVVIVLADVSIAAPDVGESKFRIEPYRLVR